MIGGLKRRLTKSVYGDAAWDMNSRFESNAGDKRGVPEGVSALAEADGYGRESNDVDMKEYYKGVIKAAIQQRGTFNGQSMSVHWLRMILSGLEMRPVPPEAMWDEDVAMAFGAPRPGLPQFEELFPSDQSN
jgi:hypothetical protein